MKRAHLAVLAAPILLFALERRSSKETRVGGVIADAESLKALANVEVRWGKKSVRSDADGRYSIDLPEGIQEVRVTATDRPPVGKLIFVREAGATVRQDVLLPASLPPRKVLLLDRGSPVSKGSSASLADQYGNSDELLPLGVGGVRAWSPVWLDEASIAYGQDRIIHREENKRLLGAYRFRLDGSGTGQILSGVPASSLSRSPRGEQIAIANQKQLYVTPPLRKLFELGANDGRLLSIAWAADDRIYFTVEDRIHIDNRRSIGRSRIASIAPDGRDLRPHWASAERWSYRYPLAHGRSVFYARFALDGSNRSIWRWTADTGTAEQVTESALRPVHLDEPARRLYYIDRQGLHVRDLRSGADFVILGSVEHADYRR